MYRAILCVLAMLAGSAHADDCDVKRQFDEALDLAGATSLAIAAVAGELEITGQPGISEVRVEATICASSDELANATEVDLQPGTEARVSVLTPEYDGGGFFSGNQYVYVDLVITVPDDLPLDVKDSSGDLRIGNVAALSVKDSSGDIEVSDVTGLLRISDSSGNIDVEGIEGDLLIAGDSSGDIRAQEISGSVRVAHDSSGDIRFSDVEGDVVIEQDSSGSISVASLGGDFRVDQDGSGEIAHRDVAGNVEIPDEKR